MDIEVRLFAFLTEYLPPGAVGRRALLTVDEGATVEMVLDHLGIPRGVAKLLLVDGLQQRPETVLQNGNVLSVFPPIAGG